MDKYTQLASLWDEWLSSPVKSQQYADYEASGLLMGMKHNNLTFTTNRLRAARRLTGPCKFPLWPKTSYSQKFPLAVSMTTGQKHKPSVSFTCPADILRLPKNLRSAWSWLKGLWGSTGGLYFPKAGYYLALIISDPDTSEIARAAMTLTGLSWCEHRHEFTLRNHDDIMTFLCNAGMPSGALDFDATVIMRSVRSRANRESNYDNANIARSLKAAHEQTITARKVMELGFLEKLPANLRELITLRLEYPDESLSGLGKKLSPEITKAAVKYRWRKIQSIIDTLNMD